jgi:hypothetical protein
MRPSHILDLAWGAAIVIATLLLADYAMAQTPAGWNGRGPFLAFGRVWPTYIAPPRAYWGPPAGRQPRLSFVPRVELPPSPAIAPAATPAPPPARQAPQVRQVPNGKRPMPWGPFERTAEDGSPAEAD